MGQAKQRGTEAERIKQNQMTKCIHEAAHCFFAYHAFGVDSFEYVSVDTNEIMKRESGNPQGAVNLACEDTFGGAVMLRASKAMVGSQEMDIVLFAGAAASIAMTNIRKQEAYNGGDIDFRMSSLRPENYKDFCDGIANTLSTHKEQISTIQAIADKLYEKRTLEAEEVVEIIEA